MRVVAILKRDDLKGPDDVVESVISDLKNRSRLKIAVLGPGEPNREADPYITDCYAKRCQIKEELNRLGHRAEFYEDFVDADDLKSKGVNLAAFEIKYAKSEYESIVILPQSYGSFGEFLDFAGVNELRSRMVVCVDKRHKNGYSLRGHTTPFQGGGGKIIEFTYPEDLHKCHLKDMILEYIQMVSELKQLEYAKGINQKSEED